MSRRRTRRPGTRRQPQKAADTLRSMPMQFSESEFELLEEQAEGRNLSELIREVIVDTLNARRPQRVARAKLQGDLERIGNELEQIVRTAEVGCVPGHLEAVLRQLLELLTNYRRELIGSPQ